MRVYLIYKGYILVEMSQLNAAILTGRPKFHILIMGYSGHGKRTVCDMLNTTYGFKYSIGSLYYCCNIIYPQLASKYGFKHKYECWNLRHLHEEEWFNLIKKYNSGFPLRTSREIWSDAHIYSGLRDLDELNRIKGFKMVDLSLWINANKRIESQESDVITVSPEHADHVIDNNGTREDLLRNVKTIMNRLDYTKDY